MIQNNSPYYHPNFLCYFYTPNFVIHPVEQLIISNGLILHKNHQNQIKMAKIEETESIPASHTNSAVKREQLQGQIHTKSIFKNDQMEECQHGSLKLMSNHNILPNKISLILSYIRRKNKSGKMVEKIINKLNKQKKHFTTKKYYAYQFYLKENLGGFTHKESIAALIHHCDPSSSVFTVEEQQFYNSVCRVLIQYFLREVSIFQVLHRLKLKNSLVYDHFIVHRYLLQILRGKKGMKKSLKYHN